MESKHFDFKLKVMLLGGGSTGKTSWINTLKGESKQWAHMHARTMGVEVYPIYFSLSNGQVAYITIWDCGSGNFSGLGEGYYHGADGALVFRTKGSDVSAREAEQYLRSVEKTCGEIPVVLCDTKVDLVEEDAGEKPEANPSEVSLSVETGTNLLKPVEILLRKIREDTTLEITRV